MQIGNFKQYSLGQNVSSPNHLVGKVVLLIGNDTAVLKTIAMKLAQKGADIALFCRQLSTETVQSIKTQVEALGRRFLLLSEEELQASNETSNPAENLIKRISNVLGQLDIFIDLSAAKNNLLLSGNQQEDTEAGKPDWQIRHAIFSELAQNN